MRGIEAFTWILDVLKLMLTLQSGIVRFVIIIHFVMCPV